MVRDVLRVLLSICYLPSLALPVIQRSYCYSIFRLLEVQRVSTCYHVVLEMPDPSAVGLAVIAKYLASVGKLQAYSALPGYSCRCGCFKGARLRLQKRDLLVKNTPDDPRRHRAVGRRILRLQSAQTRRASSLLASIRALLLELDLRLGSRTSPALPISRLDRDAQALSPFLHIIRAIISPFLFSMSLTTAPANYKYGRTAKDHSRHWMCVKVTADSRLGRLPDLLSSLDDADTRVAFAGAISNAVVWDECKAVGRLQFREAVVWICFLKKVPARMAEDIASNIASLPFLTFLAIHSDIPFKSVEDAELILGFVGWMELYGGGTARVERWVREKFERYFPAAIEGWRQHEQHARVHTLIATGELKWQTKAPPIPAPAVLTPNPVAQSAAPVTASTWTPPNIPPVRVVLTSSKTATNRNLPSVARDTRPVELKNAVRMTQPPAKKRKKEDEHVYTRLMTAAVKGNKLPITWPGHRPTFTE